MILTAPIFGFLARPAFTGDVGSGDPVWTTADINNIMALITRINRNTFYATLKSFGVNSSSATAAAVNTITAQTTATLGGGSDGAAWTQAQRFQLMKQLQQVDRMSFLSMLSEMNFVQTAADVTNLATALT